MATTALEFILEAKKWPLGRDLVTAVDTAADRLQGAAAVKVLMVAAGINDIPANAAELAKSGDIYDAVLKFLEETGFAPPLRPRHKY